MKKTFQKSPAKKKVEKPRTTLPSAVITGIYRRVGAYGRVIPDDRREIKEIMILQNSEGEAKEGDRVVVTLVPGYSYKNIKRQAQIEHMGRIVEILGDGQDPQVAETAIIRRLGLRTEFPPKVLSGADHLNRPVTSEEMKGRSDWRHHLMVTIDGEDTRDVDDAISLEKRTDGQWRLGVHIADVAHYVRENSPLDKEAFARSTSVYFPDRVLPMLPAALSNGICSLNEGVDRLAMSCIMTINDKGQVTSYVIEPTLIRVWEKLTYPQVQGYLNRSGWSTKAALSERRAPVKESDKRHQYFKHPEIEAMALEMAQLCIVLRKKRSERGGIDFNFPEAKILMKEDGTVAEVVRKDRMLSEMMIEEFMIAANETVATHYHKKSAPFLYRVHEAPTMESIKTLNRNLSPFGVAVKGLDPMSYQKVLDQVKGSDKESVVSTLLLRSLAQARYDHQALGHFGLASGYYSHFTAPIRRYADLAIHRLIKAWGPQPQLEKSDKEGLTAKMEKIAQQTSLCERVAEEAERKVDGLKKAEYMARFVGEDFEGVITGVTNYGLYVALENTVEGMAHISTLQDYFEFDEEKQRLYSARTRKSYQLGQRVQVRLTKVDPASGYIDFDIQEKTEQKPEGTKSIKQAPGKKVVKGKAKKKHGL